MSKTCKRCGVTYGDVEGNFYTHPSTADKYRAICKKCWKEQTNENNRKRSKYVAYNRDYLKELRIKAGLTVEKAAKEYNMGFNHYNYLEYKGKFIKKEELKRILKYHGVTNND